MALWSAAERLPALFVEVQLSPKEPLERPRKSCMSRLSVERSCSGKNAKPSSLGTSVYEESEGRREKRKKPLLSVFAD